VNLRERRRALAVSAAIAGAVAWPALSSLGGLGDSDGFPLSTYPMFASDRGRVVDVATVVAVDGRDGTVHRLDPNAIARTDQVIQAMVTVERAIAAGAAASAALCADVAGRVDQRDVDEVQVVVERYDTIAWADGEREPRARRVVATCEAGP
jgi:hypothetical protein